MSVGLSSTASLSSSTIRRGSAQRTVGAAPRPRETRSPPPHPSAPRQEDTRSRDDARADIDGREGSSVGLGSGAIKAKGLE